MFGAQRRKSAYTLTVANVALCPACGLAPVPGDVERGNHCGGDQQQTAPLPSLPVGAAPAAGHGMLPLGVDPPPDARQGTPAVAGS